MFPALFDLVRDHARDGSKFPYAFLGPSQIRLLKILPGQKGDKLLCELVHTALDKAPSYDALSYAWGKNTQSKTIEVKINTSEQEKLPVTPNLLLALERLRLPNDERWLWCDQVCISQGDLAELAVQVNIMVAIYKHAKKVLIWIGDDDHDTPLLDEMCRKISSNTGLRTIIAQTHNDDLVSLHDMLAFNGTDMLQAQARREALVRFLNRAYLTRAWCYQEAVVAVDADVYCGYMCVPFDTLARVMLTAYYLTKLEANGTWTRRFKRSKGFGPLRAIWYDREQYRNGFRFDFLHVLWRARKYLEASKAEDMVYGFLAFDDSPSAHRIKADYTIHYRHTFRNLACSLIKGRESLEILQCIVSTDAIKTIEDSKNPPPRLPSWVPEWINRRFSGGAPILCPGMKHSFAASRGMKHVWVDSQDPDVLIVQGHVIDVVYKLIEIDFQESTYTHSSLRQILKVEQLASLLTRTLVETARDLDSMNVGSSTTTSRHKDPKSHPRRTYSDIREVALRTLLADGSFGPWQPIHHDIASLLRVYSEDGHKLFSAKDADDPDVALHRYIKDAGTIAEGKRVFLTQHLDIGLGYSSIHKGDLVVLLYGSLAPCILRRKKHKPGSNNEVHYKFVGHAYLDGWMYGDNLRKYKWWEREPKKFSLI